jgi:adenylate kinase family enzyme
MRRVAIFGNAGGGKSTLARQLAAITGLPLYVIDMLQFGDGGALVLHDEYLDRHRDILEKDSWIVDGYGDSATMWERCAMADTLIHVDMPLPMHYWWVTKRLIKGLVTEPEGWPRNSPIWSSTMSSYRVIPRCHQYLTPKYRQLLYEMAASKRVVRLRSPRETSVFLDGIKRDFGTD